jgi:hypothetical protein
VLSPDGRREIRERFEISVGQEYVELRLPKGWLGPGNHRVELRPSAGEGAPIFSAELRIL